MEKEKAMKTATSKNQTMEAFKEVKLEEGQLQEVKGGDGDEGDGVNGGVGEIDIIDL